MKKLNSVINISTSPGTSVWVITVWLIMITHLVFRTGEVPVVKLLVRVRVIQTTVHQALGTLVLVTHQGVHQLSTTQVWDQGKVWESALGMKKSKTAQRLMFFSCCLSIKTKFTVIWVCDSLKDLHLRICVFELQVLMILPSWQPASMGPKSSWPITKEQSNSWCGETNILQLWQLQSNCSDNFCRYPAFVCCCNVNFFKTLQRKKNKIF